MALNKAEKKSQNKSWWYWQERQAAAQAELTTKNISETEAQLKRYYKRTMDSIIGQFEATYNKILLSIEDGREPTPADLYKLDTYWKQQAQLATELNRLGDKQAKLFSKKFMDEWHNIYEAVAAKDDLFFSEVSFENAQQMINQIWCADGVSWSSRVWKNTALLQQDLNEGLIECLLAGRKTSELKKLLQERFNVSYNRADSIVRTEMAHIQTQAAKQRYADAGLEEVEVWADKDERRCDVCGKLHQKRFPIGGNMPIPAHPRCRCCILPVVEDSEPQPLEGTLNIEVDEFVPCLKNSKTGEIVDTIVQKVDINVLKGYNKKNGWYVNWQQLARDGYDIQAVKVKGGTDIEGLIALKPNSDMKAIYVNWAVAAPHNSPFGEKKYVGVGGHLLAVAAEESIKQGYGGYMYAFATNQKVLRHYCEDLGAKHIPVMHQYQVIWDEDAAQRILKEYNYDRV